MSLLTHLINGLSLGSIYAIIALGYTMVYGIAKMLNFAHGDVIMVGGYMCFCATTYLGWPPIAGVLLAVVVCTALGVVIERLAYKPLRMAPALAVLITAIGVSYFLQNAALLIWGSSTKSFSSVVTGDPIQLFGGQLTITRVTIVTIVACVVIMVALTLFTGKTKMGTAMRAVSEDKGAAQLMGINVNTTISLTFAIGSGLADLYVGCDKILVDVVDEARAVEVHVWVLPAELVERAVGRLAHASDRDDLPVVAPVHHLVEEVGMPDALSAKCEEDRELVLEAELLPGLLLADGLVLLDV